MTMKEEDRIAALRALAARARAGEPAGALTEALRTLTERVDAHTVDWALSPDATFDWTEPRALDGDLLDPALTGEALAKAIEAWIPTHPPARHEDRGLLGRGGVGEVRLVFDTRLRREVAKKLLATTTPTPEARARFLAEAQVTGQLDHPNIIPIYDAGFDDRGHAWFTMKRVRGRSLEEHLAEARARAAAGAPRDTAGLVDDLAILVKVCDAVAFAHDRGVIHRDLKPANVMVGRFGEVLVMDWGLARVLDIAPDEAPVESALDDAERTRQGRIAGTPMWMAPEQARGDIDAISTRTDVYSLGALLFALLTLHPPVTGSVDEVLHRVREGALPTPSERVRGLPYPPEVPPELEAVVARAMALHPIDRYPSVGAFADDVRAWLEGRPLAALEYSSRDLLRMWVRRNRVLVSRVGFTAGVAILAIVALLAIYVRDVTAARNAAEASRDRAQQELRRAQAAEREVLTQLARTQVATADAWVDDGRLGEARALYRAARQSLATLGEPTLGVDLGLTGTWLTHRPPAMTLQADAPVRAALIGDAVWGVSEDGRAWRWSLPLGSRGAPVAVPEGRVAWLGALDGAPAAILHDGATLARVRLDTGAVAWRVDTALRGPGTLVLDPDADRLVAVDTEAGRAEARRVSTGAPVSAALGRPLRAIALDDDLLVLGVVDASRRALRLVRPSGRVLASRPGEYGAGALSPDGRTLAAFNVVDQALELLRARDGALLASVDLRNVSAVRFSPDGRLFAARADGVLLELDPRAGVPIARFDHSVGPPRGLEVSAGWLLATDDVGGVRLWPLEAPPGSAVSGVLYQAPEGVELYGLALSPDERLIAAEASDGALRVLDAATGRLLMELDSGVGFLYIAGFSADGERVFAAGQRGFLTVWDLRTGAVVHRLKVRERLTIAAATLLGEDRALISSRDAPIELVDLTTGQTLRTFEVHDGPAWHLQVLSDGRRVASAGFGAEVNTVLLWDLETGEVLRTYASQAPWFYQLDVSPDERLLAAAGGDGVVTVWDLETGVVQARLEGHSPPALEVAFLEVPGLLLSGGVDWTMRLWDLETRRELRTLSHRGMINGAIWQRAGQRLLSASSDGTLRAWDPARDATLREADEHGDIAQHALTLAEHGAPSAAAALLAVSGADTLDPLTRAHLYAAIGQPGAAAEALREALAQGEVSEVYAAVWLRALGVP
ncbi:MAG: protein kinase [Alphaproteobacteria bacterium]|nr:protein kinase [Alphaproteobacteria bacterium]